MGLTRSSAGKCAGDKGIAEARPGEFMVALAGNPNVGKSTVFNALTGLNQHTGNWPGKTVAGAWGRFSSKTRPYVLVDTPGAYSLCARSAEEEVARDYILFGGADAVIAVCDATCLERNLNLVMQIIESCPRVVVCVNLLDEAQKRGQTLNLKKLSQMLGTPVAGTSARDGSGMSELVSALDEVLDQPPNGGRGMYSASIHAALLPLEQRVAEYGQGRFCPSWLAAKLAEGDEALGKRIDEELGMSLEKEPQVALALKTCRETLQDVQSVLKEETFRRAHEIAEACVSGEDDATRQTRLDRFFTGKYTGIPMLLLLLALVFYLTVAGANIPSQWLMRIFSRAETWLAAILESLGTPSVLNAMVTQGAFRVLGWVVSVMLPPMAIFFPLFTLLEDLGYLPRAAFLMDRSFQRCRACGKQCLTMAMGLGCNAAGVVGCRIIDSPRERFIAILTNAFMPCNGRFPLMVSLLAVFFAASSGIVPALLLTGVIVLGVGVTLIASKLLSSTLLKGMPSSFTLEMPPFRRPQIGKVILRSIFDRTLFVLGRAAAVAAPAGLFIWIMANVQIGGISLLAWMTGALEPLGKLMGLDGVILAAFVLAFPANEIVLPIAIMAYTAGGALQETASLAELSALLRNNGWTWLTALNTVLFSLMHWPCSTTLLTVKKETGSWKWTVAAAVLPTLFGFCACVLTALLYRLG